jgi:hypothetical protein
MFADLALAITGKGLASGGTIAKEAVLSSRLAGLGAWGMGGGRTAISNAMLGKGLPSTWNTGSAALRLGGAAAAIGGATYLTAKRPGLVAGGAAIAGLGFGGYRYFAGRSGGLSIGGKQIIGGAGGGGAASAASSQGPLRVSSSESLVKGVRAEQRAARSAARRAGIEEAAWAENAARTPAPVVAPRQGFFGRRRAHRAAAEALERSRTGRAVGSMGWRANSPYNASAIPLRGPEPINASRVEGAIPLPDRYTSAWLANTGQGGGPRGWSSPFTTYSPRRTRTFTGPTPIIGR